MAKKKNELSEEEALNVNTDMDIETEDSTTDSGTARRVMTIDSKELLRPMRKRLTVILSSLPLL